MKANSTGNEKGVSYIVIQQEFEDINDVQLFSDIDKAIDYIYQSECNMYGKDRVSFDEIKNQIKQYNRYHTWDVFTKIPNVTDNLSPMDELDKDCRQTIESFKQGVIYGCFTDYDGHGYYATETMISNKLIDFEDVCNKKYT